MSNRFIPVATPRFARFRLAASIFAASHMLATDGGAQPASQPTSRLLLGDVAVEIRPASDDRLTFAIADSVRSLVLTVLARDARRWSDSAAILLRPMRRSRRSDADRTVVLEEPGIEAGSISLTRRVTDAGAQWSLFVADRTFETIRVALEITDVRAVVSAMRHRSGADRARSKGTRNRPPVPRHR
ncbi:MAG: hypothetical protein MNPFHGCM_02472 [Gemmatimonadaceae bacterium]|nr:hypothetical protein [Gemmatimonadaceae bacterium]